jgi:hypothetical protein
MEGHQRYRDDEEHGNLMLKMFDYLETANIMQAMMPWTLSVSNQIGLNNPDYQGDGWYVDRGGLQARAVVNKLKARRAQR